jgi:hypothetical protein
MVYQLGVREIFETSTGTSIIDGDDKSLARVRYLHPDQLDAGTLRGYNQALTEGHTSRAIQKGYPVDPSFVPKKIRWESVNRIPPDIDQSYGTMIVSERVRNIIESFEPNVHQLLPVDLYRPKENVPFTRYYWLVVCNRIDSVDAKHTTYGRHVITLSDGSRHNSIWELNGDPTKNIVFSSSAIAGRHMWIDPFVVGGAQLSNELGDALIAINPSGAVFTRRDEI